MLEFWSAALSRQFRIVPKVPPRPGSSLLIGTIGSQSKPFRMISLYSCKNKSFAMIFLQKNGGGGWNISRKTLNLVRNQCAHRARAQASQNEQLRICRTYNA